VLSALAVGLAVALLVQAAATVGVLVRAPLAAAVPVALGGGPIGPVGRVVDSRAVQLGCQAVTGVGMALLLLVH
jgi:hypothetical protein